MDTGPNIMDKYGFVSMTEDRSIIDKNAWFMEQLLLWDKDMDTGPNIIDKDGLRSMYEDGWIIDKYTWFMDKYAFSPIG